MVNADFRLWKFALELIIVLPKQHYNNPEQMAKYTLGLWAGPLVHRQVSFCISTRVGAE